MTESSPVPAADGPSDEPPGGASPAVVIGLIVVAALVWAGATAGGILPQHAGEHVVAEGEQHGAERIRPAAWSVIPFVLLLGAIALLPLFAATEHWWESNLHRFYVAGGLALATLGYYVLFDGAHSGWGVLTVLEHAVLDEYIPFIVLLFSLFAISGGIRISGDLPATPATNTLFLAAGAVLASFIGTTGAAMVLIRPLLETNRQRKHVVHTIVFFIFLACNCGGCLLPIGDPPLFLGYLKGVPFLWTLENLWLPWLVTNGLLLAIYYAWDRGYAYPRETADDVAQDQACAGVLSFEGLALNVPLLVGVVLAVALLDPSKAIPGTSWHPWPFLREVVQMGLVGLSLGLGSAAVRTRNKFNYNAIVEVAALFIGIFITMQPALAMLRIDGGSLGVDSPLAFFWVTGILSSVLDNAPTYLVFFETADSQFPADRLVDLVQQGTPAGLLANQKLVGISLGAVFLGAMTYIGNGPNFMVRSIAEESGIKMPSLFGYCLYSAAVLLPVFAVVSYLFLAGSPRP